MVMIANLQYGWTLFVNPIDQKYHWGRAAIQVAFTIFVLTETWLVPIEGYLIDKFGPKIMVCGSGVLVAIAWVINSVRQLAVPALCRRGDRRHRRRRHLRRLGRQRAEVVSGSPRSCGRSDRGGLRRRLGAHRDPDRQHDRDRAAIKSAFLWFGLGPGHRRGASSRCSCGRRRPAKSRPRRRRRCSRRGATTARPRCSRRRSFWVMYAMFVMVGAGGLMAIAQLAPIAKDFKVDGIPVSILGLTLPALTFALDDRPRAQRRVPAVLRLGVRPHRPREHDVHRLLRRRHRHLRAAATSPTIRCCS